MSSKSNSLFEADENRDETSKDEKMDPKNYRNQSKNLKFRRYPVSMTTSRPLSVLNYRQPSETMSQTSMIRRKYSKNRRKISKKQLYSRLKLDTDDELDDGCRYSRSRLSRMTNARMKPKRSVSLNKFNLQRARDIFIKQLERVIIESMSELILNQNQNNTREEPLKQFKTTNKRQPKQHKQRNKKRKSITKIESIDSNDSKVEDKHLTQTPMDKIIKTLKLLKLNQANDEEKIIKISEEKCEKLTKTNGPTETAKSPKKFDDSFANKSPSSIIKTTKFSSEIKCSSVVNDDQKSMKIIETKKKIDSNDEKSSKTLINQTAAAASTTVDIDDKSKEIEKILKIENKIE